MTSSRCPSPRRSATSRRHRPEASPITTRDGPGIAPRAVVRSRRRSIGAGRSAEPSVDPSPRRTPIQASAACARQPDGRGRAARPGGAGSGRDVAMSSRGELRRGGRLTASTTVTTVGLARLGRSRPRSARRRAGRPTSADPASRGRRRTWSAIAIDDRRELGVGRQASASATAVGPGFAIDPRLDPGAGPSQPTQRLRRPLGRSTPRPATRPTSRIRSAIGPSPTRSDAGPRAGPRRPDPADRGDPSPCGRVYRRGDPGL